ncbi:hypothetical protein chiPu_0001168 [Chiloscyllium punctatum]|uniref:Uncharacterized protein n=1 Tax=Chiloscyllium punctatum TaxID=137246 RepID=A0A401RXF5_CHIPU|nr:hypothetical protein [Chiloscyllium punctatum]
MCSLQLLQALCSEVTGKVTKAVCPCCLGPALGLNPPPFLFLAVSLLLTCPVRELCVFRHNVTDKYLISLEVSRSSPQLRCLYPESRAHRQEDVCEVSLTSNLNRIQRVITLFLPADDLGRLHVLYSEH